MYMYLLEGRYTSTCMHCMYKYLHVPPTRGGRFWSGSNRITSKRLLLAACRATRRKDTIPGKRGGQIPCKAGTTKDTDISTFLAHLVRLLLLLLPWLSTDLPRPSWTGTFGLISLSTCYIGKKMWRTQIKRNQPYKHVQYMYTLFICMRGIVCN